MISVRKRHWSNVYLKNSPEDVSWYQNKPEVSLDFIHASGLNIYDPIIDVGGGTSFLVDNLFKENYTNISVLDISENALSITKKRLGENAKCIKWYEADITKFNSPQKFSLWHDRAVFHFLTDLVDRKNYVNKLKNYLRPEGHFIIATFDVGGPEKCSGLEIVQYNSDKIKNELGNDFILVNERKERHVTPSEKEQKFVYFDFVKIT